ncbi:BnaCnng65860D, partial [Brassica napus]
QLVVVKEVSLVIARGGASGGVINSEGVTRNFYPGDKLQLWHEELEPQNSLLDILKTNGHVMLNILFSLFVCIHPCLT